MRADAGLAKLVGPVGAASFALEHWERAPLVVKRDNSAYFDGLLSLADVDALLRSRRAQPVMA